MVKGRRVRSIMPCARNDDCCSPNPKRRAENLALNGKLLVSESEIAAYYQTVDLIENTVKTSSPLMINLGYQVPEGRGEVATLMDGPKTPDVTRTRTAFKDRSPSHRIELCADVARKAAGRKTPPKAKKRLIKFQSNQDPKSISDNLNHKLTHKLTHYFPVRRSVRKTKKTVLEEKQRSLEQLLRNEIEEGLEVKIFEEKGRGVVACKPFNKGDFVVEYSGDLIDIHEARQREIEYAEDKNAGCYMYYFKHNDQQYCVDATAESGRLGRLVNHSRNGNLITRTIPVDNRPRLVLIARDEIKEGDEVTYDYGDRSKESLRHHPWLAY